MQVKAGVLGQPGRDVGVLVGRVVIEDQMDLQTLWDCPVDRAQEREELGVAVTWEALADHRSGQNIERGEQGRGAVALVAPTSAQQALGRPGRYADAPENFLLRWVGALMWSAYPRSSRKARSLSGAW